ncbi:uncharacterized protein [Nicotiana tomentosiformis]|uniref:uncharacterized protein n=1 Tax=Nicotiana tomentosiformis TaxID=4098 RepID=UPI00388C96A8
MIKCACSFHKVCLAKEEEMSVVSRFSVNLQVGFISLIVMQQLAIREDIVRVKEMLFEEEQTIENRIVLQKSQAKLKKYLSIEEQYWKQKAVEFFQTQFTQEGDSTSFELLNNVSTMVTLDQNLELCKFPTIEEFKGVVMTFSSYYRSSMGGASLPKSITRTNIVLLPKKPQYGFVKGRSIFENILFTQKIVTDIRLRGKPGNVVIKLRASWKYLLHVLRKMEFAKHFINMIWNLLSNNWYSVLINGQASRFFKSTRGVKQGDPLSPALFILSAEVLSRSLNKMFEDKRFIGDGMPKWTDLLNHLAYTDDTIIFASADPYSLGESGVMTPFPPP